MQSLVYLCKQNSYTMLLYGCISNLSQLMLLLFEGFLVGMSLALEYDAIGYFL